MRDSSDGTAWFVLQARDVHGDVHVHLPGRGVLGGRRRWRCDGRAQVRDHGGRGERGGTQRRRRPRHTPERLPAWRPVVAELESRPDGDPAAALSTPLAVWPARRVYRSREVGRLEIRRVAEGPHGLRLRTRARIRPAGDGG